MRRTVSGSRSVHRMIVVVGLLLSTALLGSADAADDRSLRTAEPDTFVPVGQRVPIATDADFALVFLYGHRLDPPWYINCEAAAEGDTLRLNGIPVWPRLADGSTFDSYLQTGPRWDRGLPQWDFSERGGPMPGTPCTDMGMLGHAVLPPDAASPPADAASDIPSMIAFSVALGRMAAAQRVASGW